MQATLIHPFPPLVTGILSGVPLNMVDYYKVSIDPNYITIMTQLEAANMTGFSLDQYYAFWINAYNFAIVRTVRDGPLRHIRSSFTLLGRFWRMKHTTLPPFFFPLGDVLPVCRGTNTPMFHFLYVGYRTSL